MVLTSEGNAHALNTIRLLILFADKEMLTSAFSEVREGPSVHLCSSPGTSSNHFSLPPPHCARWARAPYSIHHHPRSKPLSAAEHKAADPAKACREVPDLHGAAILWIGPQQLTFLFLEICTAILPLRAAERKGSGSLAEVGIKGVKQPQRTARRRRLWVSTGNVVFTLERRCGKEKRNEDTYRRK